MNTKPKKGLVITLIKVTSIVLISSAIGLETWNVYARITSSNLPASLAPVFWIERFAVTIHLIEGVIAAFYAPSIKKIPLQYGAYTFFVGTVALLELFEQKREIGVDVE